jgi:hypothetical protein
MTFETIKSEVIDSAFFLSFSHWETICQQVRNDILQVLTVDEHVMAEAVLESR